MTQLVKSFGLLDGAPSRPAVLLDDAAKLCGVSEASQLEQPCLVGIDLGATWLRLCRVGATDAAMVKLRTPPGGEAPGDLARELLRLLPGPHVPARIGVARAPGVDAAGAVTAWPSRPDWLDVQLLPIIHRAASRPTHNADDGVCAALWEDRVLRDELPEESTTACLTVGTGLGVGVVRNGTPLPTGDGADTIAHLPLGDPDAICACGRRGCVQATLAAQSLRRALNGPTRDSVGRILDRVLLHLRNRYEVRHVVLTGGGLQGVAATELLASVTPDTRAPRLRISATPAFSALGGALLLAAGVGAESPRVMTRLRGVLRRWQTLANLIGAAATAAALRRGGDSRRA